jgi:hypothetical protein
VASGSIPYANPFTVDLGFLATSITCTCGTNVIVYDANVTTAGYTINGVSKSFSVEGGYVNGTGFRFWPGVAWSGTINWTADGAPPAPTPGTSFVLPSPVMILYALDRSCTRIGIVSEYEALVWTSNAWDHSKCSMKCPADSIAGQAVFLERTDTTEAMIVTRRHVVVDNEKGDEYLEIEARGATLLLERRVNWWTLIFSNTNLAVAIAALLANAVRTYQGVDRSIAGLHPLVDLTTTPYPVSAEISWGSIAAAIFSFVQVAGFTFGMRYVPGGFEPFVRRGSDWSADVVFATEYADLTDADLDIDDTGYANLAVIGGEGEGADRTVLAERITDGLELAELWVDAKDLQTDVDVTLGVVVASAAADTLTLANHGLVLDNGVRFDNTDGALPTPLDSSVTYFARDVTASTFKVSLTPGGAAINLTDAGTGTHTAVLKLLTPAQYTAALMQRGIEKLAAVPVTRSFEASVTQDRFIYREDYSLGDRVSYRELGFEGTDIISSVTETFEKGAVAIEIGLGKTAPTIRQLIG